MIDRPWWQKIFYNIWPKTKRVITSILFFIFMILRKGFQIAKSQLERFYYYD